MVRFYLKLFLLTSLLPQIVLAQDYTIYGSIQMGLKRASDNVLTHWFTFGNVRAETDTPPLIGGINSPFDIAYNVEVNKAAGMMRFSGSVDGHLRKHSDYTILGNIRGDFVFTYTGINFDVDPLTNINVFAIGRSAIGFGQMILTSPDNSVDLNGQPQLIIPITDKYKMPGPNNDPRYGNVISMTTFNLYSGFRLGSPGHLFFTGTGGTGTSAWFMSNFQARIGWSENPDGTNFVMGGGDFHGDLVPNSDRCGIVGGDGTECCEPFNQIDLLRILDNNAKVEADIIKKIAKIVKVLPPEANKQIAKDAIKTSEQGAIDRWVLTWQNQVIGVQCEVVDNSCVQASTQEILNQYFAIADDMKATKNKLKKIVFKTGTDKQIARAKSLSKQFNKVRSETDATANLVEVVYSVCF